jgi:putative ABC transport system permease protein
MPPLYRLLSLRYILLRWERAALVIISIALGVATLVSSRILNACIETASTQSTTPMQGSASLLISNGELGVLRSLGNEIHAEKIPGVTDVQPLIFERITFPGLDERVGVLIGSELSFQLLGESNSLKVKIELTGEGPLLQLAPIYAAVKAGEFQIAADLWERIPQRLILVSRALYEERKARGGAGRPLVLRFGSRKVDCLPIGVVDVDDDSPFAALGKNFVGMEVGQAVRFIRAGATPETGAVVGGMANLAWDACHPQRVNRIDVFLDPKADIATVETRIRQLVGNRAKVHTPDTHGESTQEIVSGMQTAFLLCSFGAMVVGLFLVYNALSVTVAERRHDIGILRSLGATRGQIIRLFAVAAIILGIVGSVLGIPLGIALARFTMNAFQEELASIFLNPDVNPAMPSLSTVGLAFLAGILTALLAAMVPAIQASSAEPADAVRRSAGRIGGVWALLHQATCALLIGGGIALVVFRHAIPARIGAFGGMMSVLTGLLFASPIIVGLVMRLVQPILRRVLPIEARLAADNLIRSPGRTGVVIGALGAGVAVMIQTAGVMRSNSEPITAWLEELIQADQFVFAGNIATATSSQSPFESQVLRDMAKIPGVEDVTSIRYVRPNYNGTLIFMLAMDTQRFADATQLRAPGGAPGLDAFRKLPRKNAVVMSDNFALKHSVKVGDTITISGVNGPVQLEIVDQMQDYSWSRGSLFIDRAVYAKLFNDDLVDVAHVFLTEPTNRAALDRVRTFASDRGMFLLDRPTVHTFFAELIDRVFKLAYLQQIVVGIVAALGIVTALLISVLQRKRELGLLLAVGATPSQVIRSVLWEALLMGIFGTALGVVIGVLMQWYVLKVILIEESGFRFELLFPWRQAVIISLGSLTVATLAGLLPAYHAVKTRIPDALQYE